MRTLSIFTTRWPLLISAMVVALLGFAAMGSDRALAHTDPPTCTTTGNSISLATLRDTDGDNVGDTAVAVAYQGETIYYETRLSFAGGTNCAIEGGSLNIDPPGPTGNTDVTPAGGIPCLGGTLDPCDPAVTSVTSDQLAYVVDCGDVLAGFIQVQTNWAGGFNHNSAHSPGSALTTDAVLCLTPSTILTKTSDVTEVESGGTVTYTYTEENDGEVDLTDVSVEDDSCSPVTLVSGDVNEDDILNVGETWVFTCVSDPITEDTTNVATAHGTDPIGRDVTWCADLQAPPADTFCDQDEQDSVTVTVILEPDLDIEKTPDAEVIAQGDDAVFTIVVTNNGDGTATDVTLQDTLPNTSLSWAFSGVDNDNANCDDPIVGTPQVLSCDFGDLLAGESRTVEITSSTEDVVCGTDGTYDIINLDATASASNHDDVTDDGDITVECAPEGEEGCTPGYWKQDQHFDSWVGYDPDDSFDSVFGVDVTLRGNGRNTIDDPTLLDALNANGGGINALARHAVAALLNASNPNVDFPYTEAQIITMVQAAVASGDFSAAEDLAEANELGCPLN